MVKEKLKKLTRYNYFKKLYEKHERVLIPSMLVFGVIVDFVTFQSIRISLALTLLSIYLVVAGATIAFINFYDAKLIKSSRALTRYFRLISPLIVQFTFGALLSASLIFYWFSGAISVSWPFILIIALLMVTNESLRHHYLRPVVQISVYYFILFSVFSLILPMVFNSINPWLFFSSGVLSLVVIYLYVLMLSKALDHIDFQKTRLQATVLVIFAFVNALYFLNIIPPIPLAVRESGVYHSLQRVGGDYAVQAEKTSLLQKLIPGQTIHRTGTAPIYVFTAIYAPVDLDTRIMHDWQYFDKEEKRWVSRSRLSFNISGGRQDGYRGYSLKSNLQEGLWRVDVETERGQVLGRMLFRVVNVDEPPELVQEIK